MPPWTDHALVALFAVVYPLYGLWNVQRLRQRLESGDDRARGRQYWRTLVVQWLFALIVVLAWRRSERSLEDLGLVLPEGWRLALSAGAVILAAVLFQSQRRSVLRDAELREAVAQIFRPIAWLLPHDPRERRLFRWLSLTAGVCEEVLYRGFLIAYLSNWTGAYVALVVSSVMFGLGHLYQGRAGMLKTGLLGLVLAWTAHVTGSLLAPMFLHALVDMNSGELFYALRAKGGPDGEGLEELGPTTSTYDLET